ncbi:hypothetical protein IJ22_47910 [Paenibacillus naphthalenovorans]|uniref:Conjugal transfer protein n=2 Tax=Paenibacillus TaxID=44249 RepID=A0A0U2WC83_9BACL|nr:hypothetical protein IJ22_47910 [Paenibacillus naphthalenovorans]
MRTANHCPLDKIFERSNQNRGGNRDAHTRLCLLRISVFQLFWIDGRFFMNHKLIRYSMQIAMIKQLLALSLITENEFHLIKNKTMRDYGIISDLTS